jgi:hypothetical protein
MVVAMFAWPANFFSVNASIPLSAQRVRQEWRIIEKCSRQGVKIFCLHDFDVSGFIILGTSSRDTRRYEFERAPEVTDIGLRLTDVREMDLASEDVELQHDPTDSLLQNGATQEEIAFLRGEKLDGQPNHKVRFKGQRVELNAMTVPQFLAFLERKLKERGVRKVNPEESILQREFRAQVRAQEVESRMRAVEIEVDLELESFQPPKGLARKVAQEFQQEAAQSWKDAIGTLAQRKSRIRSSRAGPRHGLGVPPNKTLCAPSQQAVRITHSVELDAGYLVF